MTLTLLSLAVMGRRLRLRSTATTFQPDADNRIQCKRIFNLSIRYTSEHKIFFISNRKRHNASTICTKNTCSENGTVKFSFNFFHLIWFDWRIIVPAWIRWLLWLHSIGWMWLFMLYEVIPYRLLTYIWAMLSLFNSCIFQNPLT